MFSSCGGMADAEDLKSLELDSCGFESHQEYTDKKILNEDDIYWIMVTNTLQLNAMHRAEYRAYNNWLREWGFTDEQITPCNI